MQRNICSHHLWVPSYTQYAITLLIFLPFQISPSLISCLTCFTQGAANPSYQSGPPGVAPYVGNISQVGPVPGQSMSQVMGPTPPSRGFIPVNNSVVQRPGMQPPSPTKPGSVQPPVTPAAPPPTVQTVDTSNVPGKYFSSFIWYGFHEQFINELRQAVVFINNY